jgi:hypothetical protein
MDPFTLAYLAGHSDFSTTRRYVHPQVETVRTAIERARNAQNGQGARHSNAERLNKEIQPQDLIN